ncbi:MAG TPA: hemerythrin domain-containing protein [Stenotrophobium sp.]|jgi:hypothetical protein|nr:hemerythrin domain-containing protein [Stenotrophobium sp.]
MNERSRSTDADPFAAGLLPAPPAGMRMLGRSRTYTGTDLPARLMHWHSPRANRWEHLCVTTGPLCMQWLGAGGAITAELDSGDSRWIAPGMRWRLAEMPPQARLELQIHAADTTPVSEPQALRAALLEQAEHAWVEDAPALKNQLARMLAGQTWLLQGGFDCRQTLHALLTQEDQFLFWHPLHADVSGFTAVAARSDTPVGLLDYLGRDHAVIEAVLAGTLRGDAGYAGWLHAALSRHLEIEEQLLFPRYLEAGGRASWVRGLLNEHVMLRQLLDTLSDLRTWRRLLLLLDGHDEKEEQIVYPDIVAQLREATPSVTRAAMLHLPPAMAAPPA